MHTLRAALGIWCRHHRLSLRVTQSELAERAGVTRGYIAAIETGRANPTLDVVSRLAEALGVEVSWAIESGAVILGGSPIRDIVHARCSAYVESRLRRAGWQTAREVEVVHGRSHGWIDLLAYHPGTARLLVVEVKTSIDDVGAIERQLAWYERAAPAVARRSGWRPRSVGSWLVVLASADVDDAVHGSRELFATSFPGRAIDALRWLHGAAPARHGRAIAMVDPRSRRSDWLIRTRSDGRRSMLPYASARDAARLLQRR